MWHFNQQCVTFRNTVISSLTEHHIPQYCDTLSTASHSSILWCLNEQSVIFRNTVISSLTERQIPQYCDTLSRASHSSILWCLNEQSVIFRNTVISSSTTVWRPQITQNSTFFGNRQALTDESMYFHYFSGIEAFIWFYNIILCSTHRMTSNETVQLA